MASISSTITDEFLTCSICFEIFKDPKTLPCLHSFCKGCIDDFTKKRENTNEHTCPVCRESFQLSDDFAGNLKTNFCLKNLIELVTSSKGVKKLCSFCSLNGNHIEASSQCLTCKDLLCYECSEHRHRSTTLTLNHRIVSLADVASGKYDDEIRSQQRIPCLEHSGEDLRYFCETCDIPICRDCIVLSHQNHKCMAPSEARKRMDENLGTFMSSLKERLDKFQAAKENVTSALDKLETGKRQIKENLEKQVNDIINTVMESQKSVKTDFDRIVKSKENILHEKKECLEKERKSLEETYTFCRNILDCGNDIEILTMKTDMNECLSKLHYSKNEKRCTIEEIELPTIESSIDGNVFSLVFQSVKMKMSEDDSSKKNTRNENADKCTATTDGKKRNPDHVNPKLLHTFQGKDTKDIHKPSYTSVTWVDENKIAVIDQRNQKLKFLSTQNDKIISKVIANCVVANSFKSGMACRTSEGKLFVYNNSMDEQTTFSGVLTLMTCHPKSPQISWISALDKICVFEKAEVKQIVITDPNKAGLLRNPKFGHVLRNGMFAVSDWDLDCVFLIRRSGYVERRKYCSPGSISSDSNNNIYVCDHKESLILVFKLSGETMHTFDVGSCVYNPKSIAINQDGRILITNKTSVVLVTLK
ncbi:E3 ubiquitin-protein ligase TRIM56-like [Ostrea edulis]|uniref:E3 ubiquitin-protein ligase TRIM56-like n=1 Tax=Ostrea edulis TaxID=37623 RepID=UPI0024AFBCBD|nr:E3 ubiquitin-protein ligase TRIM56-like [Ostrea edulis]XP_056020288.1 E3 ubiquitin-protein ligase TRIM56-like [Ostrea edulis]XP_056020289.1 E3 ubiquitin-protein ligase TRIM56-like [Ostrea edulis]XP_056020290.1 E3 ubiquitin-protein ligase TRIM56-like [Ostrea edulis]